MAKKVLMKGNIAMAEGAILAGCRFYAGYPITPQNEVPVHMSSRMPEVGGTFLQAESETASINMIFGAAAAGARAMTSTSSPGYSLMQEGISYIAGASLPCVLANVQRGGPGLGNISGAQSDYFQAVKGGGHGDYRVITFGPESPQEMLDHTLLAFDLADRYRMPALILADGTIGQMMETVLFPDNYKQEKIDKPWALTGCKDREKNIVRSLWLDETGVLDNNIRLQERYKEVTANEIRFESYQTEDAETLFVAYGVAARFCRKLVDEAREEGKKVGLFRPITLWPWPYEALRSITDGSVKQVLTVELSAGQMVEDVRLAVAETVPVNFFGTLGGTMPQEDELENALQDVLAGREVHHVY